MQPVCSQLSHSLTPLSGLELERSSLQARGFPSNFRIRASSSEKPHRPQSRGVAALLTLSRP